MVVEPLGSGLITRRGRWRPGGWQNGRRGHSGRSRLQDAASPSAGKRESQFCETCDPASCGHGLVCCGRSLLWQTIWSLLVMPPLLRLDAVGWALMSVASIISTSGSAESGGSGASRGIHPAQPLLNDMDDAASTPSWHPPASHHVTLGNKGRMRATCSVLSLNNWAITHLLLVLSWRSLSGERIIPHIDES